MHEVNGFTVFAAAVFVGAGLRVGMRIIDFILGPQKFKEVS